MFTISDNRQMRVCQGSTRREFLRVGSLGLGGLTLSSLLSAQAQARDRSFITDKSVPLLGPQVDHAVAAFLRDLEDRGLSDKILLLITGGGLRMGQVIGQTDRNGGEATSQQYLPEHLLATVMQTLFDPGQARLVTGLPTELARTINASEPIRELMV